MSEILRIRRDAEEPGSLVTFLIPDGALTWFGDALVLRGPDGREERAMGTSVDGRPRKLCAVRAQFPAFPELMDSHPIPKTGVLIASVEGVFGGGVRIAGKLEPWLWLELEGAAERLPVDVGEVVLPNKTMIRPVVDYGLR